MNQPAPPPPIQSLQNQGPWRVRKSPGFNKIQKYTWHHFAKFKNILPPHLPLNLYKIRGRGGSQLGRVGRVQVFGKSKQVKHVAIFMNQPAPPPPIQSLQNKGPWRVRKSPGFNKIKKYTWHHFAKFKNIHPPHLPLNLYKIRVPGGSQLGRVVVSLILRFVVLTYMGFFPMIWPSLRTCCRTWSASLKEIHLVISVWFIFFG